MASRHPSEFILHVKFEQREDGGLRATCEKVPNFRLSHSDPDQVMADVIPALETILSAMYEMPMCVRRVPGIDEALHSQPALAPHMFGEESYLGQIAA